MTLLRIEGVAVGASLSPFHSPTTSGAATPQSPSVSGDDLENKSPVVPGDTTSKGSPVASGESLENKSPIVTGDTASKGSLGPAGESLEKDSSIITGDNTVKGATNLKGNTTSIDSGNKINVYFPFVEDAEEDLSPLPEFPPPGGILYKLPPPSRKESISRQRLSLPILPTTIYKRPSLEDFDSNPDTNTIEMKWLKGKGKAKEGSNDADAGPSGPEMSQVQGTTNMTTSQGQAATATNSLAEASSNTTSSQAHGSASMSASQGQVPFTTLTPEQASANAAANAAGVAIATANVLAAVTADLASSSISTPAPAPAPDSGIREPRSPERCFPGFGLYKNVSGEAQVWYVGIRHMLKYGIHQLEFAGGMYKNVITDTYPLRDSINKIMWHPGLDHADSTALVKLGRIYARAQGDARSKPGALINRAYIRTVGLEAMAYILVDIFHKDAAARRQPLTHHTANTMTQVFETIARLEAEEEANQAEEAERKKAEQAAKKAKKEAKKAKKEAKANANRRAV